MRLKPVDAEQELVWIEFEVDPQTGARIIVDENGKRKYSKSTQDPEIVRFGLKFLTTGESNTITDEVYKTQTNFKAGQRSGSIESTIDHSKLVEMKLAAAIVKWEGILDTKGNVAPISRETIQMLPAWLTDSLLEVVNDMNVVGDKLEAE